jgi:hypothetical protein
MDAHLHGGAIERGGGGGRFVFLLAMETFSES